MDALCIIGEPGAGKTTLTEYLTADLPFEETESPVPYRRYDCGVTEIGKRRPGGFSGTDALAMNIQPKVQGFIEALRPKLLLLEGDRLSNDKFFTFLEAQGYTLHVVQLWGANAAAAQREARGSNQDPAWLRGRQTKVTGLRKRWNGVILPVGAKLPELVERLNNPVALALRQAKEVLV